MSLPIPSDAQALLSDPPLLRALLAQLEALAVPTPFPTLRQTILAGGSAGSTLAGFYVASSDVLLTVTAWPDAGGAPVNIEVSHVLRPGPAKVGFNISEVWSSGDSLTISAPGLPNRTYTLSTTGPSSPYVIYLPITTPLEDRYSVVMDHINNQEYNETDNMVTVEMDGLYGMNMLAAHYTMGGMAGNAMTLVGTGAFTLGTTGFSGGVDANTILIPLDNTTGKTLVVLSRIVA